MTWLTRIPLDKLYDAHAEAARNTALGKAPMVWQDRSCEADICLMRCHGDHDVVVHWRWMT